MRKSAVFTTLMIIALFVSACAPAATPAPTTPQPPVIQTVIVPGTPVVKVQVVTPTPSPNPEAVIPNVEPNAEIHFWTFYLSPTFDQYIKDTIARFNKAYPGVKVDWEDHQATFQDDLKNAFAAGNAPDVINLSVSEGWVSDYATQGLLLPLDDKVPDSVKALYFPGLWKEQLVKGVNYQFPWYQGIGINLLNMQIMAKVGITDTTKFPTAITDMPA